jgi:hypothetical protein
MCGVVYLFNQTSHDINSTSMYVGNMPLSQLGRPGGTWDVITANCKAHGPHHLSTHFLPTYHVYLQLTTALPLPHRRCPRHPQTLRAVL